MAERSFYTQLKGQLIETGFTKQQSHALLRGLSRGHFELEKPEDLKYVSKEDLLKTHNLGPETANKVRVLFPYEQKAISDHTSS